jgi:stage II sporulation protein D
LKKNPFNINKSQRMQLKAFICILGLLLLVVLAAAGIAAALRPKENTETPAEEHIPVVQILSNLWVMEADENEITVFENGEINIYKYCDGVCVYEKYTDILADVELTDGLVSSIDIKTEKINGKVLSADETKVEIDGYGTIPLSADYKGYQIYASPKMCTVGDIVFGYDFTDFIIENGEICGFFITREDTMENIRVLIKNADYEGIYHESVTVTCKSDFVISTGDTDNGACESFSAGDEVTFDRDSTYFQYGRVTLKASGLSDSGIILTNVTRSRENPSYRGSIELICTDDGIIVVNELPLEQYLYSVVPSEMPSSYPAEALKAQAVCARTYAYKHMEHAAYPQFGAHVDDSTAYQVYNNIAETMSTTMAVKESYGQLLYTEEGELAGTYYYSTSCGVGTDANVWKTEEAPTLTYLKSKSISATGFKGESDQTEGQNIVNDLTDNDKFAEYIETVNKDDYEYLESWYRWSYTVKEIDPKYMCEVLKKRQAANSRLVLILEGDTYSEGEVEDFDTVKDLYIAKRGEGGVCDELIIETDNGTYKVITEHNIRYCLDDGSTKVVRQDGSKVSMPTLLPSAFFSLSVVRDKGNVVGYTLTGGGFGHGVGMSQNGAKDMAETGLNAEDILSFFFENCTIKTVYENKT